MRQGALRQPQIVALLVVCAVGLNIALGVAVGRGMGHRAALVALAPVVIAVLSWIVVSHRNTLVFAALAYAIFGIGPPGDRLTGTGGTTVYITDLFVVLALGAWIVARLLSPPEDRPAWPRTPVLSWPLLASSRTSRVIAAASGRHWSSSSSGTMPSLALSSPARRICATSRPRRVA